MGPQG